MRCQTNKYFKTTEIPITFMEQPYFYYGVKIVKTTVENRTVNLPRKSGQQASNPPRRYFSACSSLSPRSFLLLPLKD